MGLKAKAKAVFDILRGKSIVYVGVNQHVMLTSDIELDRVIVDKGGTLDIRAATLIMKED